MKKFEKEIRQRLKVDFLHYAEKCLNIRTKKGAIIKFRANSAQKYIHEKIEQQLKDTGKVRALILKGRQQGCSTYVEARGVRILTKLDLQEVSLVTFPANEYARVKLESNDNKVPTERELEATLRASGLSRKQAKGVIAVGYKSLNRNYKSSDEVSYALDRVNKITRELENIINKKLP